MIYSPINNEANKCNSVKFHVIIKFNLGLFQKKKGGFGSQAELF